MSPRRRLAAILGLLLIFGAGGFYDLWLVHFHLWSREPTGFYGYQTDALASGQLYLKLRPDPHLAALPDPYDGRWNRPYRVQDLSYYRGRYYSYFGIGPILFLTLPWHLATRTFLTEPGATALLVLATNAASLLLLGYLWRRFFPEVGAWVVAAAYGVATLGDFITIQLTGTNPGAVAQQGACLCLLLAFFFVLRALHRADPVRQVTWCSLLCGLAVACRPSYVPAVAMLVPVIWHLMRNRRVNASRLATAAIVPVTVILLGLFAYNVARFGSPFEFGNRYQLTDVDLRHVPLLSLRSLWSRLPGLVLHPFSRAHFFPFLANRFDAVPVGLLWACPTSLLGLGLLVGRQARTQRLPSARVAGQSFLVAFAGLFLFLAAYRLFLFHYEVDFIVPWTFVATLGWFGALSVLHDRPTWRRSIGAVGYVLCGAAVLVSTLYTLALTDFSTDLPGLTRAVNGVVARWDRRTGVAYGPVRLKVVFPRGTAKQRLPLVETGDEAHDLCYVQLEHGTAVRFGLFHAGTGGPLSEPVTVDLARPHDLEIYMGSLLPDIRHPFFDGKDTATARRAKRVFQVKLDGQAVLSAMADFYRSGPAAVRIGENPALPDVAGPRFTGRILSVSRPPFPADWLEVYPPVKCGAATIRFRLPSIPRSSGVDPILSTGSPGRGDVVFVRYLPGLRVVFGLDHQGGGVTASPPLTIDPAGLHTLAIIADSLAPRPSADDLFELILDGRPILHARQPTHRHTPDQVYWGLNTAGSSICSPMFGGTILEVRPVSRQEADPASIPLALDRPGRLAFTVRFDEDIVGKPQPLVVTGKPGKADFLFVVAEDAGHLRFGLDHWGVGERRSAIVAFDPARPHDFVIDFGSIHALARTQQKLAQEYRVTMDGRVVFSGRTTFYPTRLTEVFIGRNPLGGSSTGPHLLGRITRFRVLP